MYPYRIYLDPKSTYIGTPLRPKYILYGYMEPSGFWGMKSYSHKKPPNASEALNSAQQLSFILGNVSSGHPEPYLQSPSYFCFWFNQLYT